MDQAINTTKGRALETYIHQVLKECRALKKIEKPHNDVASEFIIASKLKDLPSGRKIYDAIVNAPIGSA